LTDVACHAGTRAATAPATNSVTMTRPYTDGSLAWTPKSRLSMNRPVARAMAAPSASPLLTNRAAVA
jgi:hypothetical protein